MKSWRPSNWDNPFDLYMAGVTIRPNERAEDYEAGADAILRALKTSCECQGDLRGRKGTIVFILDEE